MKSLVCIALLVFALPVVAGETTATATVSGGSTGSYAAAVVPHTYSYATASASTGSYGGSYGSSVLLDGRILAGMRARIAHRQAHRVHVVSYGSAGRAGFLLPRSYGSSGG